MRGTGTGLAGWVEPRQCRRRPQGCRRDYEPSKIARGADGERRDQGPHESERDAGSATAGRGAGRIAAKPGNRRRASPGPAGPSPDLVTMVIGRDGRELRRNDRGPPEGRCRVRVRGWAVCAGTGPRAPVVGARSAGRRRGLAARGLVVDRGSRPAGRSGRRCRPSATGLTVGGRAAGGRGIGRSPAGGRGTRDLSLSLRCELAGPSADSFDLFPDAVHGAAGDTLDLVYGFRQGGGAGLADLARGLGNLVRGLAHLGGRGIDLAGSVIDDLAGSTVDLVQGLIRDRRRLANGCVDLVQRCPRKPADRVGRRCRRGGLSVRRPREAERGDRPDDDNDEAGQPCR